VGFVMCGCFGNMYVYVYCTLTEVFLNLTEVSLTLTEVFPCVFLSCKANARVKLAKKGHGPHYSTLVVICVVRLLFVFFGCYLCRSVVICVFRLLFVPFGCYCVFRLLFVPFGCYLCFSVVICVVRLLFVLFYVLYVCKCVLPPGGYPITVKYISYIISYQITTNF